MTEKSFFEVLEEQMRTEIRAELEREFAAKQMSTKPVNGEIFRADAKAGQFQTWVAAHIEKTYFTPSTKKAYGSPTPKTARSQTRAEQKTTASPRPARELTLEQLVSLELVRRHSGVFIEENFTESELKGAWRKAALKTHPDRFENADQITQARAAALFRELTGAYECLQAVVGASAPTAAAA
jgi:hypothetical protein